MQQKSKTKSSVRSEQHHHIMKTPAEPLQILKWWSNGRLRSGSGHVAEQGGRGKWHSICWTLTEGRMSVRAGGLLSLCADSHRPLPTPLPVWSLSFRPVLSSSGSYSPNCCFMVPVQVSDLKSSTHGVQTTRSHMLCTTDKATSAS